MPYAISDPADAQPGFIFHGFNSVAAAIDARSLDSLQYWDQAAESALLTGVSATLSVDIA
jgi:hypothetical protein